MCAAHVQGDMGKDQPLQLAGGREHLDKKSSSPRDFRLWPAWLRKMRQATLSAFAREQNSSDRQLLTVYKTNF